MLAIRIVLIWMLLTLCYMTDSITKKDDSADVSVIAESLQDFTITSPQVRDSKQVKHIAVAYKEFRSPNRHASKPTTYPFIENIVQRTVDKYMHVIRTRRDWLQRLLQLVREERTIRSKYNCSTDSCIYKIQLFTHHLPPSLFHREPTVATHRKRVRRSAETLSPEAPVEQALLVGTDTEPTDTGISTIAKSLDQNETGGLTTTAPHSEDDALRVPERFELSASQNDSHKSDNVLGLLDSVGPHPQASHFEHVGKINMGRVRQEVLTEALSRQNKSILSKKQPSVVDANTEAAPTRITVGNVADLEVGATELIGNTNEYGSEGSEPSSSTASPTSGTTQTGNMVDVLDQLSEEAATDNPTDESGAILDVEFDAEDSETLPNASILEVSIVDDLSIPAIPFGLNKFGGKPYENCTGRFENYCYNALKCVYISVLETAACYCRTGYTGVRCDMFNLPQTLDILKSFREEAVDVPSLRQPNALTLYNVVEATARYTVNAVLEEDLLSSWNDDNLR